MNGINEMEHECEWAWKWKTWKRMNNELWEIQGHGLNMVKGSLV